MDQLKAALISSPVLAHFSVTAKTFVTCDASATALGAVLSQEADGGERPVVLLLVPSLTQRKSILLESVKPWPAYGPVNIGTYISMVDSSLYGLITRHSLPCSLQQEWVNVHYACIGGVTVCNSIILWLPTVQAVKTKLQTACPGCPVQVLSILQHPLRNLGMFCCSQRPLIV